ncbi:transposase [Methylobacterium indicum]|nr:transposase [Methylobacterium indicum]KTS42966.1 transposase [Methylobacterium indicum]KTS44165.1 transposase [Methylobacterium indicum]
MDVAVTRRGAGQGAAGWGGKPGPTRTDRVKPGCKRSVLTDGRGVPVGLVIAGANVNDHLLLRETLEAIPVPRPDPSAWDPQHLCLDKGYDYAGPRETAAEYGFELHLRRRGGEIVETRELGKRARRWVVERCHSGFNRFRALLIRWSKKPQNALALLHFAAAVIAWRHLLVG